MKKGIHMLGIEKIDLIAAKENVPAISLYTKMGFTIKGETRQEDGLDYYKMQWDKTIS